MTYTPTTDDMQTAAGLAGWSTDEWREWYYTMRAEVRAQALAPIREALAGHPRCDIHPDDDSITCGWKHAVASVQAVLDADEVRAAEPIALTAFPMPSSTAGSRPTMPRSAHKNSGKQQTGLTASRDRVDAPED